MFAHVVSLIGGIDDNRTIEQVVLLQIIEDTTDVPVDRTNHPQIIFHVLLIFPFCQGFAGQFIVFEFPDDRVVMLVPCYFLGRCHPLIHCASGLFETGLGVDFIFFVGQFQVIDEVHIFDDAHLLQFGSFSSFIFVVECFGKREYGVFFPVEIARIGHPGAVWRLVM